MSNAVKAAEIVQDAGGKIIGRTRLQKIAYLLAATGLEEGFTFYYKHYGPYSEELASASRDAALLGMIKETEQLASWGGTYSTYCSIAPGTGSSSSARRQLATLAASADAIELELAATAVFLKFEGYADAWAETARRKPEKAAGRLEKAKSLYSILSGVTVPRPLPQIV